MNPRRRFLQAIGATLVVACTDLHAKPDTRDRGRQLHDALDQLERRSGGGRLGVSVIDTHDGNRVDWRGNERFAMCSTFKFLLAAAVLKKVERGEESLERHVDVAQSDLVSYSPVLEKLVGKGATIAELCDAILTLSDNAAANLLLSTLGGPNAITSFARDIRDPMTRLDRNEPGLNSAIVGDPRDTTSPAAMADDLRKILLGDVLSKESRDRLTAWMIGSRTGTARLRSGLPAAWRAGDKTGTGASKTSNDIAILWPPGSAPLLVASYLTESALDGPARELVHQGVAEAIVQYVSRR